MSMVSEARVTSDGHRHRILCVDDETRVLEGLSLQLGRRYEVLTRSAAPRRSRYCSAKITSRC
jgi:hypothetical protein